MSERVLLRLYYTVAVKVQYLQDIKPKVPLKVAKPLLQFPHHQSQGQQQIPASYGNCTGATHSSLANSTSTKSRMRWTLELHKAFVEVVK